MIKFLKKLLALGLLAGLAGACAEMQVKTYDVKCPKCNTTFTIEEERHLQSLGFGNP